MIVVRIMNTVKGHFDRFFGIYLISNILQGTPAKLNIKMDKIIKQRKQCENSKKFINTLYDAYDNKEKVTHSEYKYNLKMMEEDSQSSATSVDENTENFCDNPTRDTLAEGLMGLIKPTVDQLDERVRTTRISQLELKQHIESLAEELKKISEAQQTTVDLDVYVKKLINAKHRVTVLTNVLQSAQERLNKVHQSIERESVKRKFLLEGENQEDSFLFLDALESELQHINSLKPLNILEVGSGSGIIIAALAAYFKNQCLFYATDINPKACLCTQETANRNDVLVSCINMNLFSNFKTCNFDVILFNPPYVCTDDDEIVPGIKQAWAGGKNGRLIIDQFLNQLELFLTSKGVCYMVLLKENKPNDVLMKMNKLGFKSYIIKERKILGEYLYVVRFNRESI
ncbi:hypothetical protein FQA39_LY07023 [Lamprigera yunnana]|nr:hypothetical protein FQA39_LY07023 [Lamprigera yunnana]